MDGSCLIHLGFLNLGPTEIIVVVLIAIILFGGRLPEVARSIGKTFFEFRRNIKDIQSDIYQQDYEPPRHLPRPYHDVDTELNSTSPPGETPPAPEKKPAAERSDPDEKETKPEEGSSETQQ